MFEWLFGKRTSSLEKKTQEGFASVKKDIEMVGKWIKHLDGEDKQVFAALDTLKQDLSTVKNVVASIQESLELERGGVGYKQVFKKDSSLSKQTAVDAVYNGVQTAVQTGSFYDILKRLTAHERLLIFTVMNSDMKLSYEDLALLLGKERATIRGQINSIKQKSEGLLNELTEKNGKKRMFVPPEIKEKLAKYAKVRVSGINKGSYNQKDKKEERVHEQINEK